MKVLIVQPGFYSFVTGRLIRKKDKRGLCPSFVLPYLASLFPKDFSITLVDETIQEIDFSQSYDLVAISVKTPQAKRAYEIADIFRDKKIPVVMGGYHVNLCPDEAQNHSDAVVLGEAEGVWEELMSDLSVKHLKKRYVNTKRFDMEELPFPRYDLMDWSSYGTFYGTKIPLETSRGCLHKCSFCSTPEVYRGGARYRPINEIVEDIKRIKREVKIKRPLFVFVDDNLAVNRKRAYELFEALIPLKIHWSGYFSSECGTDRQLVGLANRSGCFCAFVGLESVNTQALKIAHKEFNQVKNFSLIAKNFRENHIILAVGIILGFLEDEARTFQETADFIIQNKIPIAVFSPLYPFPGTPIYDLFMEKGVLHDAKFWLNAHNPYALFRHHNIEQNGLSLQGLFEDTLHKLMSLPVIFRRSWPLKEYFLPLFTHNIVLRNIIKKEGVFAFV